MLRLLRILNERYDAIPSSERRLLIMLALLVPPLLGGVVLELVGVVPSSLLISLPAVGAITLGRLAYTAGYLRA